MLHTLHLQIGLRTRGLCYKVASVCFALVSSFLDCVPRGTFHLIVGKTHTFHSFELPSDLFLRASRPKRRRMDVERICC